MRHWSIRRQATLGAIHAIPLVIVIGWVLLSVPAAAGTPFTVGEDIGLAQFGDPYTGAAEAIQFSPDGAFVAALTERGRIDINKLEDTVRIFRTQDVQRFLRSPPSRQEPPLYWSFSRSSENDGPVVTQWRWLADSSGITFLETSAHGKQLLLASITEKIVEPLTPTGADVEGYDARDHHHYVYVQVDSEALHRSAISDKAVLVVGTGRVLPDLLFPADAWSDRSRLWAVSGNQPFEVANVGNDQKVVLYSEGQGTLALSTDGNTLVTALAVPEIPSEWEGRYPPSFPASPFRLRAGAQDLSTLNGSGLVSQYVLIDLRNGVVTPISDAPTSNQAGWMVGGGPVWSRDGRSIALPHAFVRSGGSDTATACVAVATLSPLNISCVVPVEGMSESGGYSEKFRYIESVRFEGVDGRRLQVSYSSNGTRGSTEYRQSVAGDWAMVKDTSRVSPLLKMGLEVKVAQGLNEPPILVATDSKTSKSRVIWDPNPRIKDIDVTAASTFSWKDKSGRNWKGGLFKPVPYEPAHRYPLVIQTHGFSETEFRPSGLFPTAFAARALAAAGMVVLQANDCPIQGTTEEGLCNVEGYEAAIAALVKQGLVDPDRIGMVGFSRTCFYVMEMLTKSTVPIRAASITDGGMLGYLQYMNAVDMANGAYASEFEAMAGGAPFREGLEQWQHSSPLFNMDKVNAALQVVGLGRWSLLTMWEPYAAMRYLHKPVDLVLINTDEHVLTNPAARLASQGGTVDWFRFWLQGYEDPDPAKAEQYRRWHALRKLQDVQDAERTNASKASSPLH